MTPDAALLAPGIFVDSDHPSVIAFAEEAIGDATADGEKAARLFRAVRERLYYDPYTITQRASDHTASGVLALSRSYCIPKAVLLAAAARAVGLPAQLGFADVKNHLTSKKLTERLGTDVFSWHGYAEVWVDGKPYKLTPAFNASLCERFGVAPLVFDPQAPADALLQPFDGAGHPYMEYVKERGSFLDLPFSAILESFASMYPNLAKTAPEHDEAFHG